MFRVMTIDLWVPGVGTVIISGAGHCKELKEDASVPLIFVPSTQKREEGYDWFLERHSSHNQHACV